LFVSTIKLTRLVDCWKIQFAASPSLSDRGKLLKSEGAVNRKDDVLIKRKDGSCENIYNILSFN
jgi:hypothetical protein